MRFGLQLWSQQTSWPAFRDTALAPALAADTIGPYQEMGFETVIVRMPAPYDRETIERMAGVREFLGG